MRDDKGEDFKVLCVAVADPHQAHVEDLDQVRPHRLVEIEHFFNTYKMLEDKETDVVGWRDAARAREVLVDDRATWQARAAPAGDGVTPRLNEEPRLFVAVPLERAGAGRGRRGRRADPGR